MLAKRPNMFVPIGKGIKQYGPRVGRANFQMGRLAQELQKLETASGEEQKLRERMKRALGAR